MEILLLSPPGIGKALYEFLGADLTFLIGSLLAIFWLLSRRLGHRKVGDYFPITFFVALLGLLFALGYWPDDKLKALFILGIALPATTIWIMEIRSMRRDSDPFMSELNLARNLIILAFLSGIGLWIQTAFTYWQSNEILFAVLNGLMGLLCGWICLTVVRDRFSHKAEEE